MAHTKGKSEGSSGGRRGHSGMDHACKTEEIKDAARIVRRTEDRKLIIGDLVARTGGDSDLVRWRHRTGAVSKDVEMAPVVETELRAREVQLLVNVIEPDPDLQAFLITDEASSLDVSSHSSEIVRSRLEAYLKRPLPVSLTTPLWILVDAIRREMPGWPDTGPSPN